MSKVKLFFLTLFTNPSTVYILNVIIWGVLFNLIRLTLNIEFKVFEDINPAGAISMSLVSIGFVILVFVFSKFLSKRVGTCNRELVTFISLMYSVVITLALRKNIEVGEGTHDFAVVVDSAGYIVLFTASILLYSFVVKALSALTDRPRSVNTALFTIPPAIFLLFYNVFTFLAGYITDVEGQVIVILFSNIILFLFIWAFYVIIRNITATNEAIEAKDLAAQMARTEALREADLNIAKNIQSSALPSVFPPFPERKEFELYAGMNAAKEVGGDFYDFYMLGDNTLGFLIADVSGKSIPGAMFMMTAKTVIKSLAESGMPPAEVFTRANEKLCEGNEAEMFVTAWLGYLDLKTGLLRVANAGHNPPVLIHDGKAEYVILKPGLMLAGMEGVHYKEQTLRLQPGDILYLYTDGVTEAMNANEEQYGEERLKTLLSFGVSYPAPSAENGIAEPVCDAVSADVRRFTNGAEQSDDMTMLCVRYLGSE